MSDINLIPQEFKIERENKVKRSILLAAIAAAIVLIVVGAVIPIYLTQQISNANKNVEADIKKLSYVSDEVKKLTAQKSSIEDSMKIYDSFTKQTTKWTGVIKDISALMPAEVSITTIDLASDMISMQCTSTSEQAIAAFIANIENSKEFTFNTISNITPEANSVNFNFNILIKYNKDESKVE